MNIIVNGKIFEIKAQAPLKEVLVDLGLNFPCHGEGKCGRCKIECSKLSPTALDKRFLSEKELACGIRLACDKFASENLEITFQSSFFKTGYKLKEADVKLFIEKNVAKIQLLSREGEIVEEDTVILNEFSTRALRADIVKPMLELFEKYSVATADTIEVKANKNILNLLAGVEYETYTDGISIGMPAFEAILIEI